MKRRKDKGKRGRRRNAKRRKDMERKGTEMEGGTRKVKERSQTVKGDVNYSEHKGDSGQV